MCMPCPLMKVAGWIIIAISIALTQCVCLLHSLLVVHLSLVVGGGEGKGSVVTTCFVFFASALCLIFSYYACCATIIGRRMTVATPHFFLPSNSLHMFSSHRTCCTAIIDLVDSATTTTLFFCFFSALRLFLSLRFCCTSFYFCFFSALCLFLSLRFCCASLVIDSVSLSHD